MVRALPIISYKAYRKPSGKDAPMPLGRRRTRRARRGYHRTCERCYEHSDLTFTSKHGRLSTPHLSIHRVSTCWRRRLNSVPLATWRRRPNSVPMAPWRRRTRSVPMTTWRSECRISRQSLEYVQYCSLVHLDDSSLTIGEERRLIACVP